jgi:hypothetical protein
MSFFFRGRTPRSFAWLLVAAMLLAVTLGLAEAPPNAPAAKPAASAEPSAEPAPSGLPHGLSPIYGDQTVPGPMLPPGAYDPDTGPSTVIYPQQQITLRFNHKFHLTTAGATCKTCHGKAYESHSVEDSLIPQGTTCDACHMTDHSNLSKVTPGDDEEGKCGFCHMGYKEGDGNIVAKLVMPRANMVFDHQKHTSRNINCQQCHGAIQELELATRDQLPRMRGCFRCHQMPDAASRGEAKSDCTTCHVKMNAPTGGGSRMRTMFASGELRPPRWLRNAAHSADWISRHKMVAGNDSQFCSNCHKEDFCVDCHDGKVRPRSIHPNDYLSMHPIEARMATQKCTSCHREQSFCLSCHQRVGVTMSGPTGTRTAGRFHPPKAEWSDPPRKPGHHGFEAQRNLNACVSCHIERDCVVCHGGTGIGGGFNPHKSGFQGGCSTQMQRNPRPCFVCHNPGDAVLNQCR